MNYNSIVKILEQEKLLISYDKCDLDIEFLSYDSRNIKEKTMFFCKGFDFKEEYLDNAIEKEILCYVSEIDYHKNIPCIIVSDIKKSMSIVALNFYPDNLTLLGVTGTKGKTTVINYVNNIVNEKEHKRTGFISTINLYTGKREEISINTTPEGLELHKYLHEMEEENLKYATLEVSSQATKMSRIYEMHFKVGCFLNIGMDHISPHEHSDFEDYLNCKIEFLKMCDNVVIYKDTDYFDYIVDKLKGKNIITYGMKDCDYVVKDIIKENGVTYFTVLHDNHEESYSITMPSSFNVLNATCAVIVGKLIGASYNEIKKALFETKVPGRVEVIEGICPIIIDYAHNGLSLEYLFKFVKEDYKDKNIKVIIGAPGDKGFARRRDLSVLSAKYASDIYLTEVDPGSKKVKDICLDMAEYIKPYKKPYTIIEDRQKCIETAIDNCTSDDILLITCKGNEEYQLVNHGTKPYKSDKKVVLDYLSKIKVGV